MEELNKSIDIDVKLYFIQAKRGKLELEELRTFYSGVEDFLDLEKYKAEGKNLKIQSSIKYYLYYFYAGSSDKNESINIEKNKMIKKL